MVSVCQVGLLGENPLAALPLQGINMLGDLPHGVTSVQGSKRVI